MKSMTLRSSKPSECASGGEADGSRQRALAYSRGRDGLSSVPALRPIGGVRVETSRPLAEMTCSCGLALAQTCSLAHAAPGSG